MAMDLTDRKKNDGPGVIGKASQIYSHYGAAGQNMHQARMYIPQAPENGFIQSFGNLNIRTSPNMAASAPPAYFYNGQVVFTGNHVPQQQIQAHSAVPPSPAMYAPVTSQYIGPNYQAFQHNLGNHSPLSHAWTSRAPSSEIPPSLITPRRDSNSSNEVDAPGTPFNTYAGFSEYQGGVAVVDRSPHSLYAYSTPSPPDASHAYSNSKSQHPTTIPLEIQILVQQDPPIPRGVPAPNSPQKALSRCLENQNGVTNVYIRGLLPETTDEVLFSLASRFGDISSSKSIIDHNTGLCKGFGFVKYHSFKDAENCIRGFHYMGYETSFARESFYAQLKKLADDDNTNLYVSNLPKDMSEHELSAIFGPHKVCSSRILRDSAGNGRGVGFARFESREACEDVIKDYNNTPVSKPGGEEHLIQIRYADSKEQKSLKQQTTAARQYRTAEYEYATQGRRSFYETNVVNGITSPGSITDNEFEQYISNNSGRNSGGEQLLQANTVRYVPRERSGNISAHLMPNAYPVNGYSTAVKVDKDLLTNGVEKSAKVADCPRADTQKCVMAPVPNQDHSSTQE